MSLNFSPGYIENLTPVERSLYKSYYIEDKKRTEQQRKPVNTYDALSPDMSQGVNTTGLDIGSGNVENGNG